MKVVIIEDEPLVAKDLLSLLKNILPAAEVLAVLDSVESASQFFARQPAPDLIFADIQLADGVSFDIFEQGGSPAPIIFTTAYDEYAIRAFKLNSIDYLLKPIDQQEMARALQKFENNQKAGGAPAFQQQLQELLKDLQASSPKKHKSRFAGHLGKSLIAVNEDQVAYFTKDVLIFLLTRDGQQVVTDYHSLEELDEVTDPQRFFRANRQFIIHLDAIDHIESHYTGKLLVSLKEPLKEEVSVSREKAAEFRKWFEGS